MTRFTAFWFGVIAAAVVAALVSAQPANAAIFDGGPAKFNLVSLSNNLNLSNNLKHGGDCCEPVPPPCCEHPCISYNQRGCCKICCGCEPPVSMVLRVKNPCTCCEVDIPVCVPACCTGEPEVCGHCGVLGRGVVRYDWCCGFSIRIVFNHCGDHIAVTYIGR